MENIKMISERLNEEKWTRATLNSYTINHFKELDDIVNSEFGNENADELKDLCDEHLVHTKNSIIALYISGVISFLHEDVDDSRFIQLIDIFRENHKWSIVEFLCERILDFGENKYALRTLAECYDHSNDPDKKHEIWERLIRIDYEEAEIVKQLAELKKEAGEIDAAVSFYKKALYRYINKKFFSNVKEIWHRMIELAPTEKDFFFHAEKKIAAAFDAEKANALLEEVYHYFKESSDWQTCITILKQILTYDPQDPKSRREIEECYRNIYAGNQHLDEYIRLSNLNQSWRNIHEAIADFEKHISFDVSNFVFHRTWGIGIIKQVTNDELLIDFARKRAHTMSLKMASGALYSLPKSHIWVLKSVWPADKLKEKLKGDVLWGLRIIIQSFENAASLKKIKAEIVPSILTQGEWTTWSTEAKKILKNDPNFGNLPDQVDVFEVRTKPITIEEKLYNQFKAEKGFYGKLKAIREFVLEADPESDFFAEMYGYVTAFTKNLSVINDQVISAFLFTKWVAKKLPYLAQTLSRTFVDLIAEVENIPKLLAEIADTELKKDFLDHLKEVKEWNKLYISLFPVYPNKYIIEQLVKFHHEDDVRELLLNIVERFKENRNSFIWVCKNVDDIEQFSISNEKVIISLIHLLDITYREIDNKQDVSNNRKFNRNTETLLIKDKRLENFLSTANVDSVTRVIGLVGDVRGFNPAELQRLKDIVIERFPDFKFFSTEGGTMERETISRGLIVSKAAYRAKQKELKYIIEVEIPKNSKEIGAAIEMGDLKENAEYKAGKEKQELLNIAASKLKEDLDRAHIYNFDEADNTRVSYGTVLTLENKQGENEIFTILGPWESNPDQNIISYLSPLGKALLSAQAGDQLDFEINEREYSYKIVSIEVADEPAEFNEDEQVRVEFE